MRLGDQFLARAAFALDQHRRPAGRHLRHQVEHAQHRVALAHDVREVVALLERALELQVFFLNAMPRHRGTNVGQQLLVVPRLLNEVLRARADRLHHVLHRAVGRDHDDGQLRQPLLNLRQQLQSALAGHGQIQQHQVVGFRIQHAQALFALRRQTHRVPLQREQHFQRFADPGLIVDNKNGSRRRTPVVLPGC